MALKFVDQNSLIYIFTKIKDNFVAQEAGKGLSTNDFTNDLKTKLEGVAEGAQVNVLEGVQVNGTDLTIEGKKVNITVPTKISDLGSVTESDLDSALAALINGKADKATTLAGYGITDAYTSTQIDEKIAEALADATGGESAADVLLALNNYKTSNDERVAAIEADYLTSEDKYDDTALVGRVAAIEADYLKEEDKYDDTALAARVKAIEDDYLTSEDKYDDTELAGRVTTVEDKVSAIEADYLTSADKYDDTALAGRVAAIEGDYLKAADKYDDTALAARVTANEEGIATLNGNSSVEGSVDQKIAAAINEFAAAVSDDGTVNTYKELIDYAATHGAEFTELVGEVEANAAAIENIEANYVKTADMVALTNTEIDEAFAQA